MARYRVGDEVLAEWADDGFLYPAVLVETGGPVAHVAYLDGDESDVEAGQLRAGCIGPGIPLQVNWKGRGRYYNATVQRRIGQAVYLHYADGDRGWGSIAQCRIAKTTVLTLPATRGVCTYCGGRRDGPERQCSSCGAPLA